MKNYRKHVIWLSLSCGIILFVCLSYFYERKSDAVSNNLGVLDQSPNSMRTNTDALAFQEVRNKSISNRSSEKIANEEELDCINTNTISFEDGQRYCKNDMTLIIPSGNFEKLREILPAFAIKFYQDNQYVSFQNSHTENVFLVKDSAAPSEENRTGNVYWADLRNEKGEVIGVAEMPVKGTLNGEEYIELLDLDPKGSAFIEKGPWESEELSVKDLQSRESYQYDSFPPVSQEKSVLFLQNFLTEQRTLENVASIQEIGYSNLYDYDGIPFAANNAFYKFVITDNQGKENIILVNAMDGRVVDENYVHWLTDTNRQNSSESSTSIAPLGEESIAPQLPRL